MRRTCMCTEITEVVVLLFKQKGKTFISKNDKCVPSKFDLIMTIHISDSIYFVTISRLATDG